MSLLGDIDTIRKELFKERFVAELKQLEQDKEYMMDSESDDEELDTDEENNKNWTENRINDLKKIIKLEEGVISDGKESYKKTNKTLQDDLDEMNNIIFKMAWNRLPVYHKIVKIEEYIKELIPNAKLQKEVTEKLVDLVNKKKLNTKKYVNYNSLDCKIIDINILKYDDKTNEYEIA